jgi:hypothetical protein
MRRAVPLLLVAVVAACGSSHASRTAAGRTRPATEPSSAPVTVVASVLKRRGTAARACLAILTSAPPAGCSGVRVAGYDFAAVAGTTRFDGGWQTPVLRIMGAWDGRTLRVRSAHPTRGRTAGPTSPRRCAVSPTRRGRALARRLERGVRAAHPLALGPCGRTAWMLVPYAGRDVVAAIHARDGADVVVLGWLAPVRGA